MFSWLLGTGMISSALNFLTPVLSGVVAFGSWYLSEMWDGVKHMFKNLSTFVVLITVALASGIYGSYTVKCAPAAVVETMEQLPKPGNFDWERVFSGSR